MPHPHHLTLDAPATSFYEALLLGDGHLGAAVHGLPDGDRIDLNSDTFWSGGPSADSGLRRTAVGEPGGTWLEPLRDAVRRRDWQRADELAGHLQGQGWTQSYQPLGALRLTHRASGLVPERPVVDYLRRLDMAAAVATAEHGPAAERTRTTSFVSAVRGVLVHEVTGPVEDVGLSFEGPHPTTRTSEPAGAVPVITWAGRAPADVLPDYFGDAADAVTYDHAGPDAEGLVDAGMGFAVAASVQTTPGGTRVLVAVVDGFRGRDARPSADLHALREEASSLLLAVSGTSTAELLQEHVAEHRQWFDRMDLELSGDEELDTGSASPADAARFFHLGRYLLIASSRPGTQPANLQGIWNTDVRPGWSCNWTTNINVQMNYWLAGPAGLAELAEPLHHLVEDLARSSRRTAEDLYGAPGWVVHHNTDLWGFAAPVEGRGPVDPACSNWPAGALWLAAHYASSHSFTGTGAVGDPEGVVRGAAELALALLQPHTDGLLVTSPSTSPEHHFLDRTGARRSVSAGSAMDQELVAEVLGAAVDVVAALGARAAPDDLDLRRRAGAALLALRPPQVGAAGDLLEWADERPVEDRGHRHVSHLYGLYPGTGIDERGTPQLFAAARAALQDRIAHGGGGTGWSQAWILCLAARLRDPALVQRSLDVLVHDLTSRAWLDLHPVPDHPSGYRFQIDGNLGAAAGIIEALVGSGSEEVRILPALPRAWTSGRVRGVRTPSGHAVELEWAQGELVRAVLTATRTRTTEVLVPDREDLVAEVLADDGAASALELVVCQLPGIRSSTWNAQAGQVLVVRRRS